MGSDNDSFTKEEMLARYGSKHAQSSTTRPDWRKRRQDEDPAGARERVDSGTTRCDRERPSRAEDTHPFGGIAAPSNIAANDGARRGLGRLRRGSSRRARSRVSASGAARVGRPATRRSRVVVPHPEQRRRPHLQRERGSLSLAPAAGATRAGSTPCTGAWVTCCSARGTTTVEGGRRRRTETRLKTSLRSRGCSVEAAQRRAVGYARVDWLFSKRPRGRNGTPQPPPPRAAPKKRPNPEEEVEVRDRPVRRREGTAPSPETRHARRRRIRAAVERQLAAERPQSTSANGPPVGSQSTNAAPVANAETSTRPAAAMFPDSLFNTSGGDFDPWSDGRVGFSPRGAAPRPSPSRPASNGRNRWDPSEGLGPGSGSSWTTGRVGRRGYKHADAHADGAGELDASCGRRAVVQRRRRAAQAADDGAAARVCRRRAGRREEEVTEGRDIETFRGRRLYPPRARGGK